MEHDDQAYIVDIILASDAIASFVAGMTKAAFLDDPKTCSAVIYQIMVMGEATSHVTHEFRKAHPTVPWRTLIKLRNIYIHAYRDVDVPRVWRAATRDVPRIVEAVRALVPSADEDDI